MPGRWLPLPGSSSRGDGIGGIPITRDQAPDVAGGAVVPERSRRLCIGSQALLHPPVPALLSGRSGAATRSGVAHCQARRARLRSRCVGSRPRRPVTGTRDPRVTRLAALAPRCPCGHGCRAADRRAAWTRAAVLRLRRPGVRRCRCACGKRQSGPGSPRSLCVSGSSRAKLTSRGGSSTAAGARASEEPEAHGRMLLRAASCQALVGDVSWSRDVRFVCTNWRSAATVTPESRPFPRDSQTRMGGACTSEGAAAVAGS
jgi:hypothetical protein